MDVHSELNHYAEAVRSMARDPRGMIERVHDAVKHIILVMPRKLPADIRERHEALVERATRTTRPFDSMVGKLAAAFEELIRARQLGEAASIEMANEIVAIEDELRDLG